MLVLDTTGTMPLIAVDELVKKSSFLEHRGAQSHPSLEYKGGGRGKS